jgi:hypothetical protein
MLVDALRWIFASAEHFVGVAVLLYCLSPRSSTNITVTKEPRL